MALLSAAMRQCADIIFKYDGILSHLTVCLPRTLVLVADDVTVCPPFIHALDDVFLRSSKRG